MSCPGRPVRLRRFRVPPALRSPTPDAAVTRWKRMRSQLAGAGCWAGDVLAVVAQPGGGYSAHLAVSGLTGEVVLPDLLLAWDRGRLPPRAVTVHAL